MLLQPGDDANGTVVLLPAWPCDWDVSFKLAAPRNTTVALSYRAGAVASLVVTPASRRPAVVFGGCVGAR
jgi:hypothetical protein